MDTTGTPGILSVRFLISTSIPLDPVSSPVVSSVLGVAYHTVHIVAVVWDDPSFFGGCDLA